MRLKPDVDHGKWFWRVGYAITPLCITSDSVDEQGLVRPRLDAITTELNKINEINEWHLNGPSTHKDHQARQLQRRFSLIREFDCLLYNSLPKWSFQDLIPRPSTEASSIASEFLRMAPIASLEFWAKFKLPFPEMRWKEHNWKHINYSRITAMSQDIRTKREPEPLDRAEIIGTDEDVKALFRSASQRDPVAVARVNYLFRNQRDKREVIKAYFGFSEEQQLKQIPTMSELAFEFVASIESSPESQQAETARQQLRKLTSSSASRGAQSRRSRPPLLISRSTILRVYKMSISLALQIRQIDQFLGSDSLLVQLYPWLPSVMTADLLSFRQPRPTDVALHIAADALRISQSTVRKTLYEAPQ